jgi:hypothetical protein
LYNRSSNKSLPGAKQPDERKEIFMPDNKELGDRTAIAICLAVFLLVGLGDIVRDDFPAVAWLWIGSFVYGLILGVPLLVLVSRTVAKLGAVRLMVGAGFAILFAHYALDSLYGIDYGLSWFGMYVRLNVGMFAEPFALTRLDVWIQDWAELWAQHLGWVRVVTYGCLGYVVARRQVLLPGVLAFILVALADHTLGWLVYLPDGSDFEAPGLSFVLQYYMPELLRVLAIQTGISVCVGLLGAAIGRLERLSQSTTFQARGRTHLVRRVPRYGR